MMPKLKLVFAGIWVEQHSPHSSGNAKVRYLWELKIKHFKNMSRWALSCVKCEEQ